MPKPDACLDCKFFEPIQEKPDIPMTHGECRATKQVVWTPQGPKTLFPQVPINSRCPDFVKKL